MKDTLYRDYREVIRNAMQRDSEFQNKRFAYYGDAHLIIDAWQEGAITRDECIRRLMRDCHRSRETALMNMEARLMYGAPGYGERCKHVRKPGERSTNNYC